MILVYKETNPLSNAKCTGIWFVIPIYEGVPIQNFTNDYQTCDYGFTPGLILANRPCNPKNYFGKIKS